MRGPSLQGAQLEVLCSACTLSITRVEVWYQALCVVCGKQAEDRRGALRTASTSVTEPWCLVLTVGSQGELVGCSVAHLSAQLL